MMFPLAHALLSAGGGDSCIVPSNWQQVGTPYTIPTSFDANHHMVPISETDVVYGDRSDRLRRIRWNGSTFSEPGTPFVTTTSVRSVFAPLSETRIVYYADTVDELRVLDWDEGTSSWSENATYTTVIDFDNSAAMCALSEDTIAVASPSSTDITGLALLKLISNQWTVVGNIASISAGMFSSLTPLGPDTVVYCGNGLSPQVFRHDGTDWVLLSSLSGSAQNLPQMTTLNGKTFAITNGTDDQIQLMCYDEKESLISLSGSAFSLPASLSYSCAAITDGLIAVFDRDTENLTMYSPNA